MRGESKFPNIQEEYGKEMEELICLENQQCSQQQRNKDTESRIDRERCQESTGKFVM